jgi:glutathione S-transferase
MTKPHLFVGNKNYSSWSLRPWLALRWAGIDFDETVIPLQGPGYGEAAIPAVKAVSPTGKVPALRLPSGVVIWDSLAICVWAAEQQQGRSLWPADADTRAVAWSAVCEMHSGFGGIRRDLSMNLRRRTRVPLLPAETQREVERVFALWRTLRALPAAASGPWLVGSRSVVDAFFAPVCGRFRSYGVDVPADVKGAVDAVLADADFCAWEAAAQAEPWSMPATDALYT